MIDAQGRVLGMTVLGPRRRALAIPTSTIERAVDQLLARGHVFRAYLGAGLRSLRGERRQDSTPASSGGRGVLIVDVDPEGPAKRAGLLVGDVITSWNDKAIDRVRDVVHLLGRKRQYHRRPGLGTRWRNGDASNDLGRASHNVGALGGWG